MYQKSSLEQLKSASLGDVKVYKASAEARKVELEGLKVKGGKGWTAELQQELDDVVMFIVDVEEFIDEKEAAIRAEAKEETTKPAFVPAPGTEAMVHVKLVQGRRFNPNTGKEESVPFVQMFSFSEWQLFKQNHANIGYTILEELHNPYK